MEKYIKHQLNRIDFEKDSPKEIKALLKGIYAVLESKGHKLHEINKAINNVAFENIKELIEKLRKTL